nr:hypothetical protein [Tanacetum cinerariifolium]
MKTELKCSALHRAASARYWKILACCDDDDYDYAITPEETENSETENSVSMRDDHLDITPATESDVVIKSSVEDLVPIPSESKDHFKIVTNSNDDISSSDDDSLYNENIKYVEASPHNFELVGLEVAEIVIPEEEEIEDDNLREKLLNVHLLIANIEALKDNPAPSSEFLTKSLEAAEIVIPEEEEIEDGNLREKLLNVHLLIANIEALKDNPAPSSEFLTKSTATHSDISLSKYDSFIFDFANEEFVDELTHIISPPEYDRFYFWNLPDPGEVIAIFNTEIRENLSTTGVNLPIEDDHSPFLAYVVWIFLAYLTYPVIPPYLHPFGNEDTIFDPGITNNRFYSFKPGLSHRCGAFKKFNTHCSHLNECPMIINGKNTPILDVLLFHFYPP